MKQDFELWALHRGWFKFDETGDRQCWILPNSNVVTVRFKDGLVTRIIPGQFISI